MLPLPFDIPALNMLPFLAVVFGVSLLASLILTPLCIRLGFALKLVDIPGGRRQHVQPTPRCGGIAVFVVFQAVTLSVIALFPGYISDMVATSFWLKGYVPASFLLFAIGIMDDRKEMRAFVKLGGQIAAASVAWAGGVQLDSLVAIPLPYWVDYPVTILLMLGSINAMNLIDGMDGVAAGLASISAIGLAGLFLILDQSLNLILALALTGAALGFLRYNFHPASIFLGDTGSMFLGFTLISIMLTSNARSAALVIVGLPFLVLGVPFIDTLLAIWRRSVRKMFLEQTEIFGGDQDHLHHRLARKGLNQHRVALLLYAVNAGLIVGGLILMSAESYRLTVFTFLFFALIYVLLRHFADLELMDSGRAIVDGIRRPGRRRIARLTLPLVDLLILAGGLAVMLWFSEAFYGHGFSATVLLKGGPIIIVVTFALMAACGIYNRVWRRARISEYLILAIVCGSGVIVSAAFCQIWMQLEGRAFAVLTVAYLGLIMPGLIGLRMFPRMVQDLYHFYQSHGGTHQELSPVLIYGAGYGYTLFTRAESFAASHHQLHYRLVGLVDDDPSLIGWSVHGHRVLGTSRNLDAILANHKVDGIIVTTYLTESNHKRLMEAVHQHDLTLKVWRSGLIEDESDTGDSILVLPEESSEDERFVPNTGTQLSQTDPLFLPGPFYEPES